MSFKDFIKNLAEGIGILLMATAMIMIGGYLMIYPFSSNLQAPFSTVLMVVGAILIFVGFVLGYYSRTRRKRLQGMLY